MRSFAYISIFFLPFIMSCNSSRYDETMCKTIDASMLAIQFRTSDSEVRTLTINPNGNTLTFKGTTLSDMKWVASFDSVKAFKISERSELSIQFTDGHTKSVGTITQECQQTLEIFLPEPTQLLVSNKATQ